MIDIRGQNLTNAQKRLIVNEISKRTGKVVSEVRFKERKARK